MNWILARLREPSTWRGIVLLLTALGIRIQPDVWEYIAAAGMAIAGLIGVLTADEPKRVEVVLPPIDLVGRADPADQPDRVRQPPGLPPNAQTPERWIDNRDTFPDGNR